MLRNLEIGVTFALIVLFLLYIGFRLGVRFLVRRIAGLVFVLLGVTFITFIMGYFAPGDAALAQLGVHYNPTTVAALRHAYGLDLPWYQQYLNFLGRLLHLDLGMSFYDRSQSVWDILGRGVPVSCELGLSSLALTILMGVPLGLLAAVRADTRTDTVVQTVSLVLYALPNFVLIFAFDVLMIKLADNGLPNLPVAGWDLTQPQTLIAPILIDGVGGFAFFTRLTRTSMLEVLHEDFIRAARAKGLNERVVVYRHAFRNALLPLITVIGPSLAFLVNGGFVTELFFNIPGIGYQTVQSIEGRDWPVVQGTVIILTLAVVLCNLLSDVLYGIADPRIKVI